MKMMNLFRIGYVPLLAMAFYACQKTDLRTPELTSDAKGVTTQGNHNGGGGPQDATYSLDFSQAQLSCRK